jgi:2-oxoglutarate dehydrogenase E1 component
MLKDYRKTISDNGNIQWALAELIAFGSLLLEGTGVRLSGEDSRRGTFSQRHAVLYDQESGNQYVPLLNLGQGQGQFCVYDSSLAEASILGFDYGYSLDDPDRLILWEAQFGDFSNGAQVIIDQFIAAALSKWRRYSGLVMLLPHGYEGQGPEHSNGWLGRHLSLCAEENLQVCLPTTPAQYFHLLRRQMRRDFRRPLIVLTPKSMLRNPRVTSPLVDFQQGHFSELLDDTREIKNASRVLFCSGKVYYDLVAKAEALGVSDIPIVRVEQFYPINEAVWEEIAAHYGSAREWVWVSEEPTNFGGWSFMQSTLQTYFHSPVWYIGRARSASPATGSKRVHDRQQDRLVSFALQPQSLQPELVDGIAVYTRGEELWHMKSKSPHSGNPSVKAQSHSG